MTLSPRFSTPPFFALVFLSVLIPRTGRGQTAEKLSSEFVPDTAIAVVVFSPHQILASPEWELMPIEVFRAAGLQYVGVNPEHIADAKAVIGMPGPAGPTAGVVFRFSQDYAIENLNEQLLAEFPKTESDGRTVYRSRRQPPVEVFQPDPRTIVVGVGGYLGPMLSAGDAGTGQVPSLVRRITRRKGITAIVGLEQIRPMVTGLLKQQGRQLPPPLMGLTDVAELTDAVLINVDYAPLSGSVTVSAIARDEASAQQLDETLNTAIDMGKAIAMSEVSKNIQGDTPVDRSAAQYIERLGTQLSAMIRPQRNGKVLRIDLSGNVGTTGMLVGLLLPAVQSAREAARRTSAMNRLKQIAIAMHNYHSVHKTFPAQAIRDASGTPLLSWRVAILPYLEQQTLYEQFHLDEPWDSPHNIQFVNQMPEIYQDPSVPPQAGRTVFQVPVGEKLVFGDGEATRIRDIRDGTSNTILVVETSRDAAVPWTKPADFRTDASAPLAGTGNTHPGGFNVVFADGSARFISGNIDPAVFWSLLTAAGGEIVNF